MHSIDNYKSLILEMDTLRTRLKCHDEQKEQLKKLMYAFVSPVKELRAMVYTDMPPGGCSVEYGRLEEAMTRLENMILIDNTILDGMIDEEQKINEKLKGFDDIKYKVAYMKIVKDMPLQDIATELKYTLGYIKNISAEIKKERV